MTSNFKWLLLVVLFTAACDTFAVPTVTPTRSMTGPTLAPTEPAFAAPPSEVPGGSTGDTAGSNNPTAAALPNDLDLPPLVLMNPGESERTVQITLPDVVLFGELYTNVPVRAPGVLLLSEDRTRWGGFPAQLEENGYVVLSVQILADLPLSDFTDLLGSFADFGQGDDSRLDPGRIAVIGELYGADYALRGCAADLRCDALGLISPTAQEGALEAIGLYSDRPLLVTASDEFPIAFQLAESIAANGRGSVLMQPFVNAGAGTEILQNRTDFAGLVIGWLAQNLRG